jgi:hypothetical protein
MSMNVIVMNTRNSAVTEHQIANATSITPSYIGTTAGIHTVGGATDAGTAIDARVMTGKTDWGTTLRKLLECAYVSMVGAGKYRVIVKTEADTEYAYPLASEAAGEAVAKLGRGIKENRMAFGFENVDGAGFRLDSLEIPIAQSSTRRTK